MDDRYLLPLRRKLEITIAEANFKTLLIRVSFGYYNSLNEGSFSESRRLGR